MDIAHLPQPYRLERAEKNLFAVFQALYSHADTEQWHDWQMRLNDTLWSDDSYFLTRSGEKLGGVIVKGSAFLYPFLVAPFCDRGLFYRLLHRAMLSQAVEPGGEIVAHDVLDEDVEALLAMGYRRTSRARRVMIRPTEPIEIVVPVGFEMAVPVPGLAEEITQLFHRAFAGGAHAQAFGEHAVEDTAACLERYQATGTLDCSGVIYESSTGRLTGACLAGVVPNSVNGFAGIADVAVLPEYQNHGLGAALVKNAVSRAYRTAQAIRLVVTIGNPADSLYRRLGFIPGPRFTRMVYDC